MATNVISLDDLNEENKYIKYFVTLKDDTFIFNVSWSDYCECAFLDITDYNDNPIVTGKALVNNLKIRNNKLPYILYFVHLFNENYEPTIDNISSEFAIVYDDEVEVA